MQQSEGTPGASISVRVRGGISITQSNEPLYIIDGFPSEDGMSTLDPAEIETIDVLKDASATAMRPVKACVTSLTGTLESSLLLTEVTDPVKSLRGTAA